MSAWRVDKAHIDVLVTALYKYEVVTEEDAPDACELGQMLWDENHKSVNHRYREDIETPPYHYEPSDDLYTIVRDPYLLYKQIGCYHYQSCEHDEWDESKAGTLTSQLLALIEKRTGMDNEQIYSFNDKNRPFVWGIHDDYYKRADGVCGAWDVPHLAEWIRKNVEV